MQVFFVYLVKATICSGLLFIYYLLLLRDKQFHMYNRFYLLFSVVLSLFLPCIHIPLSWQGDLSQAPLYVQTLDAITYGTIIPEEGTGTWVRIQPFVLATYLLISTLLLGGMILSLKKISSIRRKYTLQSYRGVWFCNTDEKNAPFSFLRTIFWNRRLDPDSAKGQQIFRHELFHIRQLHSVDLIFMQTVLSIAWINPFFYLIKKELSTIHEYLADRFAISGNDPQNYAEFLLSNIRVQEKESDIPLAHCFFHSQLKRRITMILKNANHSHFPYFGRIMSFPLLAVIFCSFALHTGTKEKNILPATSSLLASDTVPSGMSDPEFKGGAKEWGKFLRENLTYPQLAQDSKKEGRVVITFIVNRNGDVEEPVITTDPGYGLGEEALRVIKLSSGQWKPAVLDGRSTRAYKKQLFVFKLSV